MTEKSCTEQRESYWDYMGRRLREDKSNSDLAFPSPTALYTDDMCKKEIAEIMKLEVRDMLEAYSRDGIYCPKDS